MVTDNWPVRFRYISRRLTREIADQYLAAAPAVKAKLSVDLKWIKAELEQKPVDAANYRSLARLATEAVSDNTGTLDAPGEYIRTKLHLHSQKINVLSGWEKENNHEIAAFCGIEVVPNVGRVFVGLVGSAYNLTESLNPATSTAPRTPSNAEGLYKILQECLEEEDPAISANALSFEKRYLKPGSDGWFDEVVRLFVGARLSRRHELLDVLIDVHRIGYKQDLDLEYFDGRPIGAVDVVVIGAPVWVSTPLPEEEHRILPSGWRSYQVPSRSSDALEATTRWSLPPSAPEPEVPAVLLRLRRFESPVPIAAPRAPLQESPALLYTSAWDVFDSYLDSVLTAIENGEGGALPHPPVRNLSDWADFTKWFVDQAIRFGSRPVPFGVRARSFRWARLKWEWKKYDFNDSGQDGWLIGVRSPSDPVAASDDRAIVLSDGSVFRCDDSGRSTDPGEPEALSFDMPESPVFGMVRAVALWHVSFPSVT